MRFLWRVVAIFLAIFICLYTRSAQAPLLVRLGLRRSSIPQFIRDTEHPWVLDNTAALESIDATTALCNSESPLRLQLPPIPDDLFKDLMVDNNRASIQNRLGWDNARDRLSEIQNCAEALQTCENLRVDIYRYSGGYDGRWEPKVPPNDVPRLFVDVLSQMTGLRKLEWLRPSDDTAARAVFETAFHEHELHLPTVKEMHLASNMQFLVPMAPELTTLAISSRSRMYNRQNLEEFNGILAIVRSSKHLKTFHMDTQWSSDLLEGALDAMPFLQELELAGAIGRPRGQSGWQELENILSTLSRFKDLSSLRLSDVWSLDLFDYDPPFCGNIYFGLSGTKYGRSTSRWSLAGIEKVDDFVSKHLPDLQSLCIGGTCGTVGSQMEGQGRVWPWTGRLKEYLLDDWPRYRAGDSYGDSEDDRTDEDPNGPIFGTWEDDEAMLDENWALENVMQML